MSISSTSASLSVHGAFLALLFLLSSHPIAGPALLNEPFRLLLPRVLLKAPPALHQPVGGHESGSAMPLPAAQGRLPTASTKVFVPPLQVLSHEHQPLLELPPAVDLPAQIPNVKSSHWGDPLAQVGALSSGRGRGGSIGEGEGRMPGNNRDKGVGTGDGPGLGGVFTIGRGVTAPRLVYKAEPEYSEDARRAKYQGEVQLRVVVDENGAVRQIDVSRALGLGLDEKAVEAVRKWRFQPGRRDGKAVAVWAVVEVNFRLL